MNTLKPGQRFEQALLAETKPVPELQKARQYHDVFEKETTDTKPEPAAAKSRSLIMLMWLALLSLVALGGWQWVNLLTDSWSSHWLKGLLSTVVSVAVLLGLFWLLWREWRLWRRLQRNRQWQHNAERIKNSVQYGEAGQLCLAIAASLPQDEQTQGRVKEWQQAVTAQHSDQEQLQLFEYLVLSGTDKQVQQVIQRAAAETSIAVAVSPFALADMLLVLWRSSRMLREVTRLYGGSLGQLRSLLMLKRLLAALLWAGGSEMALDMASDVLGSELTSKVSARAGQGVIAGLLVARIGNLAQQQLRPLPAEQASKVNIGLLVQSLVQRFRPAASE